MEENIKLGPGTVYFGSEPVGEVQELSVTTDICKEPISSVITIPKECTFEGKCYVNRRLVQTEMYSWLSNNWLKMHGWVMYRNRAYNKIKRSKK